MLLNALVIRISGKRRQDTRIKPVLKGCCLSKSPFSVMYFITLLVVAVFFIISNKSGVGVALVHTNLRSSAGSFSLLFTTGTKLSFFTPNNFSKSIFASKLSCATQVDYFVNQNSTEIFWYDATETKIFKAYLTETGVRNISAIVSRGIVDVKEMAIDRFSRNVYWVDFYSQKIEVAKLDGTSRTTVVSKVNQTSGMNVDPELGYLFWSSGNMKDYFIERSFLNGEGRRTIVRNLNFPTVFTLDLQHKMIYFTDRSGILQRTDYDGKNKTVVLKLEALSSVFSLVIWNGTMYWTDSIHQTVSKVDLEDSNTLEVLTLAYPRLYGMKIFHPLATSVTTRNKCLLNNGQCSHLCLTGKDLASSCFCPYGLKISGDNKTCTDENVVLGYATKDAEDHFYFVNLRKPHEWVFPPITVKTDNEQSFTVDPIRKEVYWVSGRSVLKRCARDGSLVESVINLGYFIPQSLALDWVSKNLFMLLLRGDNQTGTLAVVSHSGEYFTHLIWEDLYRPGMLSVDSKNKILFWSHTRTTTDGSVYFIESCFLNGQNRKILFSSNSDSPVALTTDSHTNQVCWVTDRNLTVTCRSYFGERNTILRPNGLTSVISSSNGLFFYSNGTSAVKALNVSANGSVHTIVDSPVPVRYMTLFDSEGNSTDICTRKNSECINLCLPLSDTKKTCVSDFDKSFLLYLTESSEPHSLSLDDSSAPNIFPSAIFAPDRNDCVAILAGNRTRYFWVKNEKEIFCVNQDGTSSKKTIESEHPITGIAVDWIAGNLYWSVSERSEIWMSRLTGDYPYIVVHRDVNSPTTLAVHPVLGLLFWKECVHDCTIKGSTLSGRRQFTVVSHVREEGEIFVEIEENRIYWTSANGLERSDIYGNHREIVIPESTANVTSFAVSYDSIFWIDGSSDNGRPIMRSNKNGSQIVTLNDNTASKKIMYVSKELQKGSNPCAVNNGDCQHLCLYDENERYTCQCSYSSLSPDKKSCTGEPSYILLANRNRIESVRGGDPIDPNPPKRPIFPHVSVRNVIALCYHREIIYFADLHHSPFLFSVRIDGSDFRPVLKEKRVARQIEGIAFEEENRLLLWTDTVTPSIGQFSLATRQERTLFRLKTSDKPRGVAVASSQRKLFWTNWNDVSPKIETSFLNGSNHRTLLLSTLGRPNGLTVEGDRLYWTDSSADFDSFWISSCGLDGSDSQILYAGTGGHPFDIVAFGKSLFWSDWGTGSVQKISRHGPSHVQLVLKNLTRPLGMTVVKASAGELKKSGDGREEAYVEGCENGCVYDVRTKENPKSCDGSECEEVFTIQVREREGISIQTKMCISVAVVTAVILTLAFFLIRRLYKRRKQSKRKWIKTKIRPIYKQRLNSIDSDRLTMDAVVVERVYESHRRDDRISLVTETT